MSWLYSVLFAGLLFSSNGDGPVDKAVLPNDPPAATKNKNETERFEQTYPFEANGRISVSNVNGSITVEGWDRNEIHIVAVKTADSKADLEAVDLRIDARPAMFVFEADYENRQRSQSGDWRRSGNVDVDLKLQVPRTALLQQIGTVNGSVQVNGVNNRLKVSVVNGDVDVSNVKGVISLSTVNGAVKADLERPEPGSSASLSTVSGNVALTLASDVNVTIKADSLNGPIKNDFGLQVKNGAYVGRSLFGRLGAGGAQIKMNSVNGPLVISKKNDGRPASPATNLLNKGRADDVEDSDADADSTFDEAAIERQVARAMRDSQREIARSQKEAQRAVESAGVALKDLKLKDLQKMNVQFEKEKFKAELQKGLVDQRRAIFFGLRSAKWPAPAIEKKRNSFPVKGDPSVTINAPDCSVSVRGWDRSEVRYTITTMADHLDSDDVSIKEEATDKSVSLTVLSGDGPSRFGSFGNGVRIEVFVPKRSDLKIASDGQIRLEGVSGMLEIIGSDGDINIRDSEGKLFLNAGDGLVRVVGFNGEAVTKTVDGDLYLEGKFDRINASAEDGSIFLTLPQTANASLFSNNPIRSEGFRLSAVQSGQWQLGTGGANYSFRFVDGKLILRDAAVIDGN